MPDIMAIVSKAVFERDARVGGKLVAPGDVWAVDRYNSTNKALEPLTRGGRIFLVTARPGEALWLVGVVERPVSDGTAWIAPRPNTLPVTDITSLRGAIRFESGKGISTEKGALGMSLQTPRALTADDVAKLLGAVSRKPAPAGTDAGALRGTVAAAVAPPARVIDGRYEILRPLGQGGMGAVYEARHTGTGRRVALKEILGEELKKDPSIVARLQREARATGEVESRHIAPVLDSGTDPTTGHPYLVMELLHGEDLQHVLARSGALAQDVAIAVVAQACIGLSAAHRAGVIHRDIKPANLFLARRAGPPRADGSDEVVVKILDFGIARVRAELDAGQSQTLTATGLMLGTPLYMSPEQVMGPKKVDRRSDVWSLGVVLYEALSGTTPHADVESMGGLLVAICSKPARPLLEVAPHVRRSVAAIASRALEIDPARRHGDADELLSDLTKELSFGVTITDEMLGLRPASVRGAPPLRPAEGAEVALAPTIPQVGGGTLRSASDDDES